MVVAQVSAGDRAGLGWTYGSAGCSVVINDELSPVVVGKEVFEVGRVHDEMVRACRNIGRPGVGGHAISAVDIAVWDLKARLLDLPLCDLLTRHRDDVPVYGSGGFTNYGDELTSSQIERWVDELGIPAHLRNRLALDVTAGEYGYAENYFATMVAAGQSTACR